MNPTSPEAQLRFLLNIQRLLNEGLTVSTYKFALLLAIADHCVEAGFDTEASLTITTAQLAERFIQYYWRQARPYGHATKAEVLSQNKGRQAAVIKKLQPIVGVGTLYGTQQSKTRWRRLVKSVATDVRKMPLWKLQTVGKAKLEFLYPNVNGGHQIVLRPGVMFCFRKFHQLITDLVRGAWIRYIRQKNSQILGGARDLDEFLFGSERAPLRKYLPILTEVQDSRCLYCGRGVVSKQAHIDHFIPWSLYPIDYAHNFVLSHESCNSAKDNHLASPTHLHKWIQRNRSGGDFLSGAFEQNHLVHDITISNCVARWAYEQTSAVSGLTWVRQKILEPLSSN